MLYFSHGPLGHLPPDVFPRGCSDLNSPKRVARPTTTVTAMGGENAESPVAVTEGCPAFADGCPYGKNVEVSDWIKEKREDALDACPAFKDGCPFDGAADMAQLQSKLEGRLALQDGCPTADFKLLWNDAILRNEQLVSSLVNSPVVSMIRGWAPRLVENVGYVAGQNVTLAEAISQVLKGLEEENVEQGQVLWIDLHCSRRYDCCAYFSRDLPGRGKLQVAWDPVIAEDGKEVISVTASPLQWCQGSIAGQRGVQIVVFSSAGEATPGDALGFVSASGGAWEMAAAKAVLEINELQLQHGQLLGIDAHNYHPDAPAMFGAMYSRDLPGHGPRCLDWVALNQDGGMVQGAAGCKTSEGKEVVSITGSSNCEGRSVQYTFWQVSGDVPGYVEVECRGGWDQAAEELIQKLRDAGVLSIDAHNCDLDSPAVLLAVFRRSLPSRGPLTLRCQILQGRTGGWRQLYQQAEQAEGSQGSLGANVVPQFGIAKLVWGDGLVLLLFLGPERPGPPLTVRHLSGAATWWNGAADQLLQLLRNANVQRNQLLTLDAHNDGPNEAARFTALYSLSIPGDGELRLQYRALNVEMPWPCLHKQAAVRAASGASMMITGSSNESSRRADEGGKSHEMLLEMLKTVHKASQSMKQSVGAECPVFQDACPFKNCTTSQGTPLALELETRSWGLWIQEAEAEDCADGLAKKLKEGTAEAHKAAESVHFVKEFIKCRVDQQIYAQFVVNLYHIYQALEEALDANAEHPLVESLHFPDELERAETLKLDAEYYLGSNWQQETLPSKTTREYVQRLQQLKKEAPELLIPHAYTRYLGDLSGGQLLKKAAIRGMKLPADGSGVHFYNFRRIPDTMVFKNMYRARMDSLHADSATADRRTSLTHFAACGGNLQQKQAPQSPTKIQAMSNSITIFSLSFTDTIHIRASGNGLMSRIGDVVIGRTLSIAAEGLLVKLPQQDAPALLPRQVAYSGITVGDEICDLLVVWLYPDGRGASVVVPEAAAEELVTGVVTEPVVTPEAPAPSVRSKGRWGAASSSEPPAAAPAAPDAQGGARLMPFLVQAAEAPSYASVALVKPESTGSHRWTKKEEIAAQEEAAEGCYSKQQLLQIRNSLLLVQDAGESASSPLPTSMPCQEEDLDRSMLQMVVSTRQLPVWWTRCSREAKQQAFRIACRTGRMRILKAIHGDQESAQQLGLNEDFLTETLKEMCSDAQSSEGFKPAKKHKRTDDAKGVLLSRTEAQALVAWSRGASRGFAAAPAAAAAAWLVERGAAVELLLPEAEGQEALSSRLRGLGLLAEFGPAMMETASSERAAHIVEAVAGCLRDPEASGRKAASDALLNFGPSAAKASRALPRLLRLVQKDSDSSVREAAAKALGCLGHDGLSAMDSLGEDVEVQGLKALTIGTSGMAGAVLADRLPDLLEAAQAEEHDEHALQRRVRVADALGLRGDLATERQLSALAQCLQREPEQQLREACAYSLGQIGRSNKGLTTLARAALEVGLEDPAVFVKEASAAALKMLPQLGAEDFDVPQSIWQ
eukprot:s303_g17.t1